MEPSGEQINSARQNSQLKNTKVDLNNPVQKLISQNEIKIVPLDYEKAIAELLKEFPTSKDLLKAHGITVLNASNSIRKQIQEGKFVNISSKQLFNIIHNEHFGKTAKDQLLACCDMASYEEDSKLVLETAVKNFKDGFEYKQKTGYRGININWDKEKGIKGINPSYIPDFTEKFFPFLDQLKNYEFKIQYQNGGKPEAIYGDNLKNLLIASHALLDIAHLGPEANGKTDDDLFSALYYELNQGENNLSQALVTTNGLRPGGIDKFLKEKFIPEYLEQQTRITTRAKCIKQMSQWLYKKTANDLNVNVEELKAQLNPEDKITDELKLNIQKTRETGSKLVMEILDNMIKDPISFMYDEKFTDFWEPLQEIKSTMIEKPYVFIDPKEAFIE